VLLLRKQSTQIIESINYPINKSIIESINQLINQSIIKSSKQATKQAINQSIIQAINQPINQWKYHYLAIYHSINKSIKSINQSVN